MSLLNNGEHASYRVGPCNLIISLGKLQWVSKKLGKLQI